MPNSIPDFPWYSAESQRLGLPTPRCPFASVHACPRYYQSLSLLGQAGCTPIDKGQDKKLLAKWEHHPLWPATMEQATGISKDDDGPYDYHHFCPEVAFDTFGLFVTYLCRYARPADRESAHQLLAIEGTSSDNPRWIWQSLTPQHYSECPLYSSLTATDVTSATNQDSSKKTRHTESRRNHPANQESPNPAPHGQTQRPTVFISYAHSDGAWLTQFERHLKPLLRGKHIDTWSDRRIQASDKWHDEIQAALARATAAVLLVSKDFLYSDYIADHELPVLLKNAADKGLKIFSIILSPCAFEEAQFNYPDPRTGPHSLKLSVFQAINSPSRTLKDMRSQGRDRTLLEAAKAIAELASAPPQPSEAIPPSRSASGPQESAKHIPEITLAYYNQLVQKTITLCSLADWDEIADRSTCHPPRWRKEWLDRLYDFNDSITRAVWPGYLPTLECAIRNVSAAFKQALDVFHEHSDYNPDSEWCTGIAFYKGFGHHPNYDRDAKEYRAWLVRCVDTIKEVAKALNWFSDTVRCELDPGFRLDQGYFSLSGGEPPPRYTPGEIPTPDI